MKQNHRKVNKLLLMLHDNDEEEFDDKSCKFSLTNGISALYEGDSSTGNDPIIVGRSRTNGGSQVQTLELEDDDELSILEKGVDCPSVETQKCSANGDGVDSDFVLPGFISINDDKKFGHLYNNQFATNNADDKVSTLKCSNKIYLRKEFNNSTGSGVGGKKRRYIGKRRTYKRVPEADTVRGSSKGSRGIVPLNLKRSDAASHSTGVSRPIPSAGRSHNYYASGGPDEDAIPSSSCVVWEARTSMTFR